MNEKWDLRFLELARVVNKQLNIPIANQCAKRIRPTQPQTETTANKRASNIREAFAIDSNFKANHVAIIDDIVTTGSTIKELSRMLRQHGITTIDVWCIARVSHH